MGMAFLQSFDRVADWWFSLPAWVWVGLVFLGAIVIGYLVERAGIGVLKAWAHRTRTKLDDVVIEAVHPGLAMLVIVVLVWIGLRLLPITFRSSTLDVIDNAATTLVVLAFAIVTVRLVRGLLLLHARRHQRWQRVTVTGSRLAAVLIYVIAFMVIIKQYDVEISPILTTLGLAGLAVALALQDTLSNFFAGLWIQSQRSLQPGHYVKLEGANLEGFVVEVGWRTTKMHTLPGNLIDIPNQKMAQSIIQDFSLPRPEMGTSLTVVTGFEADPERVVPMMLEECMAAADEVSYVLKEPAPAARLNRAVENGWEFWMSIWIPNYYDQWNAQGYVLNRIRRRFLKEGIRVPYPIRETYAVTERSDLTDAVTAGRATDGDGASAGFPSAAVAQGHRSSTGTSRIEPEK